MLGILAAVTECCRTETRSHWLLCKLRCSCSCRALPIAPPPRP